MQLLVLPLLALGVVNAIEPPRQPHQPLGNGDKILRYNETVPTTFGARSVSFDWVASSDGEDGVYIFENTDGALTFQNVETGEQSEFLAADKIPADYWEYWIKPDLSAILWSVNYTKQYRYSYFADYLIQDVASGEVQPLVEDQVGDVQYAEWNPVSNQIAYVRGNNLFIWENGTTSQITEDGDADHFNGVPDWVYEEEIFGGRSTFWFSPDGEYIAYLAFDETGVETFTIPYYMDNQAIAPPYPRELELRYPKVSEKNPTVSFHLLDLGSLEESEIEIDAFPADDLVIGEVAWVTDDHQNVVYRAFNRVQDQEKYVVVNVEGGSSTVTRERDGSDGWLDNSIAVTYLGAISGGNRTFTTPNATTYYLDVSDVSGWNQIYLYPVHGGKEIALTNGEWEVRAILKIDTSRNLVYFTSTEHHSTESHIYSVNYVTLEKKAIVDDTVAAMYTASFSTGGTYYILTYRGPDVPYQELYNVNSSTPIRAVSDNKALWDKLQTYNLPNITYLELEHPEGFSLNAMLRLPPTFDPSKKYPVMFLPYGGPGAQEVTKAYNSINWKAYITSDPELEFITLTVDNRGTGYKGRAFRSTVTKRLGYLEPRDQVWAAKELAKNSWVDAEKIGMWGWSYGGYLTAKTIELADPIFSFGVITAPVSDWRFYDSMYTERYMKTIELNPDGYNISGVYATEGFKNISGGFLIQHGSGDDNVHFQNAAALVDLLVGAKVSPEKMSVQWFTDSDHSIVYNNANAFLYKQLTRFVWQQKNRVPTEQHQWSKRGDKKKGLPVDLVV